MDEMVDVLDADGQPTGAVLAREEVHEQELWHAMCFVWVINSQRQILLQKRQADRPNFPGKWDISAGGHVASGETLTEAAVKELAEEVGITAQEDELVLLGDCQDDFLNAHGQNHRQHVRVYALHKSVAKTDIRLQESEVAAAKFISISQIEADLSRPGWKEIYAGRNKAVYDFLFNYLAV